MITNTGKKILAKYLIGQTPSYASHIAVGCGAKPLEPFEIGLEDYSNKKSLDFESFRVPIISRGIVTENGVTSIVLTAEAPTADRFEITEFGIYPAASNPSAGDFGSRPLFVFSQSEGWEYHEGSGDRTVVGLTFNDVDSNPTGNAFLAKSSSKIFGERTAIDYKLQAPRLSLDAVLLSGSSATLTEIGNKLVVVDGSNHIHYNRSDAIPVSSLDANDPNDEIRLAFSIVNATTNSIADPTKVKIFVDFQSTEGSVQTAEFAKWSIILSDGITLPNGQVVDFSENRYYVVSTKLSELERFGAWSSITSARIFVEIDGPPGEEFYLALDGMNFVNVTTENPLYGLVGYSKVKAFNSVPILKEANTRSFLEFRFGIDMGTDVIS